MVIYQESSIHRILSRCPTTELHPAPLSEWLRITPVCVGTSTWYRGEHSLGEWPIPTQLLVWGTLFAVRCNPWSGRWDPGGWVMVNVCNRVHCHWQYTTSARSSCRREVRNGPTWSVGWSRQAQESTTIVLLITASNKHCFILVRWLGSIGWFLAVCLSIPTMHPWHDCLEVILSSISLVGLGGGWGHICLNSKTT